MAPTGPRPDFRSRKHDVASIRYNNPGAQWPGPVSKRFNQERSVTLRDGQGNKIAVFHDSVDGAAAQMVLLAEKYAGKTLENAIAQWSGGNSVGSYLKVIRSHMAIERDAMLTHAMLRDRFFMVPFARAMAQHEAGKPYPMDEDWWHVAFDQAFPDLAGEPATAPPDEDEKTHPAPPGAALPPPVPRDPPLTKVSRKARVTTWFQRVLSFFGLGGSTLTIADITGTGGQNVQALSKLMANGAIWGVLAGCLVGAAVCALLLRYMEQDRAEGRYIPSRDPLAAGGAPTAARPAEDEGEE